MCAPGLVSNFGWPVSVKIAATHVYADGTSHNGSADIAAGYKTPIGAARKGIAHRGYNSIAGYFVRIAHGAGYETFYGHMYQQAAVGNGQWMNSNQFIGYIGGTGDSTGPHMHFKIMRWGTLLKIPGLQIRQYVTRGDGVPGAWPGFGGGSVKALRLTGDNVQVRTGPGTGFSSTGHVEQYFSGGQKNGWPRIWFDGRKGWIPGGSAQVVTGVSALRVTADVLNVRTGPGLQYSMAGTVFHSPRIVSCMKLWAATFHIITGDW